METILYPSPLVNKSVACWLNSFIQAICSLPQFCKAIRQGIKKTPENNLYNSIHGFIIRSINGYDTTGCTEEILTSLKKTNRNSMFSVKIDQNQQCVAEFFTNLLETLKDPNVNELFSYEYAYQRTCPECNFKTYTKDTCIYSTVIKNENRELSCNKTSHDVSDTTKKILGTKEHITCTCSNCGKTSDDFIEIQKMITAPKCLVMIFNKAVDNSPVILDEYIKFKKKTDTNVTCYKLMATICHFGIPESGHYIVNCLRRSSHDQTKWFTINDQIIRQLDSIPLKSADIFMAFYSMTN